MSWKKFKTVLGRGLALAIPLAIVLYVFGRIIGVFVKLIAPLAIKLGISRALGELTLTIFAIGLIILLILFLGLLMQIEQVSTMRTRVESIILQFVPSLNQLKLMAADSLDLDDVESTWRPVLVYIKEKAKYNAAFVVEEDDELITLFVAVEPAIKKGEILIVNKEKIELIPVTFTQLHRCNRAAGKGFLELIREHHSQTQTGKLTNKKQSPE